MSRHRSIDSILVCAPPSTVSVRWESFVQTSTSSPKSSPIDAFYEAHAGLTRLSSLLSPGGTLAPDLIQLLGGQILLGYVSATELYLRQAIAAAVRVCPVTRRRNKDQMIPFGALDYYPANALEDSLTERTSFSEPGTIAKQLNGRLNILVANKSSLERSISDFERVCQLRHSLIHSHGVMNSTNAGLFLDSGSTGSRETAVDAAATQYVASLTMNLVRDVNTELVRNVIWCWVQAGVLTGDSRRDRPRLQKVIGSFSSVRDSGAGHPITDVSSAMRVVKQVLADMTP